jgi:hypothetical protein
MFGRRLRLHLIVVLASLAPTVMTQTYSPLQWAKGFGNEYPPGGDVFVNSVAIDAAGNRYVTGSFYNNADFDPGSGTVNLSSAGGSDIFLAKYDASGGLVWAKAMGGTSYEFGQSVAVDGSGNALVTGYFEGTADFDPGSGAVNLSSSGGYDVFLAKYDASGGLVWAKAMGGTNYEYGRSVAVDGSGNAVVTGYFEGTADFDPGSGEVNLTTVGNSDVFLAKYDASGGLVWAKAMGGGSFEQGQSVAVDGSGNVVVTGIFSGTADFDPGSGTVNLSSDGGSYDVFLAKYDASGSFVWASAMGGAESETSKSVAVDGSGNAVVTGYFEGTADFDPGSGTVNLSSAGGYDVFLAKYDASGGLVWAKAMGGTGFDYGQSVALDGSGNAVVTGYFEGTADFDPGSGEVNLTTVGNSDVFLAKYDASGGLDWAKAMGGTDYEDGQSVSVDGSGNAVVTGNFSGTADFDPGSGTLNLTAEMQNGFMASYAASTGALLAVAQLGGLNMATDVIPQSVVLDGSGNQYVTGYFYGTADFDPGSGTVNLSSAGGSDVFLAKYDASGGLVWAKAMGGGSFEQGRSVAVDGSGNVVVTGIFYGTADFDPGSGTVNLSSAGGSDVFLAKYDATGGLVWAKAIGGTKNDEGISVAVDGSGNAVVTGKFRGTADFDPGSGTVNLSSAGGYDVFLAKYDASGGLVWAKAMGGTDSEEGQSVAVDGSGNAVLTGYFYGTADFDPGSGTVNLTPAGGSDVFLAKYDASGGLVWANAIGGTDYEESTSVSVDGSGNTVVTGIFFGTADFDPGSGTSNLTSSGNADVFLSKYDASGGLVWANAMGGTEYETSTSVAVNGSGNPVVTGYFYRTVDFDPSSSTTSLTSMSGGAYGFLAKYASSSCTNPTSGGTIEAAQSGNSPFDPSAFTSSAAASGHTGTLEYKWQSSTTGSSTGFGDITGATSATYDAGSLSQTTWFRRLARVSCQSDWTGAAASNVLEVTVTPQTWSGAMSTDWTTSSNWVSGVVPTTTSAVSIPDVSAGSNRYPSLSGSTTIYSLNLASGSSLQCNDKALTLTSDLSNSGTISATDPAGKIIMGGSSAQTISGTGTVKNLQISNASGVSIASGSSKLNITGVFSQTAGVLTTNGNLVFRSTVSEEGVLGSVNCTTEPISGDVTVEKYIPAKRAFRFLSPGVTTTTTINANWQEGSSVASTSGYPYTSAGSQNPTPGYGTHITGSGGSANGFDASLTNNPSLFTFNVTSNSWVAEPNTNLSGNVLRSGEGYRIMVRGSRSVDLNDNAAATSPTTLRTKGTLNVCAAVTFNPLHTIPLNAGATGYSMVGNPYWSVVDWSLVEKTNIEGTLYYWDPTVNGTNNRGAYVTVNTLGVNSMAGSNLNQYIQPGQAFFVRNTATSPVLTFERNDIVDPTSRRTAIFGRAGSLGSMVVGQDAADASTAQAAGEIERIQLSLFLKDRLQTGPTDGAVVLYKDGFRDGYAQEDAGKLTNLDENLSVEFGGMGHSILGLPGSSAGMRSDTIPLKMWNLYPSEYVLRVGLKSVAPDREVWLYDRSTGRSVQVEGGQLDHAFVQAAGNARKDDLALVVHNRKPVAREDGSGRILLYPNPTRASRIQVAVPMDGLTAEGGRLASTVEVVDLSGVLLTTRSLILDGRGRGDLDVSGLRSGSYVLRVRVGEKTFTAKMIRQ